MSQVTPEQQAAIDKFVEERRQYLEWREARAMRSRRNRLLADSDWTQTADCPLPVEEVEAWATWRQQLREHPMTEGFPWVPLPEPPFPDINDPRPEMNGSIPWKEQA